ncbi:MAG: hypothetical protein E7467_05410 [Ruminococcaceae bacterium]|nr:hypothetical protein [Oscillospiraceae bacterium]
MKKHLARLVSLLLTLAMLVGMLPTLATAALKDTATEDALDYAAVDALFAQFDAMESSPAKKSASQTAKTDAAMAMVIASDSYVEGSIERTGNAFTWWTTDGIHCIYDPYMREKKANMVAPENPLNGAYNEPKEVKSGFPTSDQVYLIGPYYGSDADFTDQYKTTAAGIAKAIGDSDGYTLYAGSAATVDNVAKAVSNGAVVIFDSHGTTDSYDSEGYPQSSGAKNSYLCLETSDGITNADYNDGCMYGSGYAYINGETISNHMSSDSPSGIVFMAICLGMATDTLCRPLRNRGVEVVYGYSQSVSFDGEYLWSDAFWENMNNGKTVASSVTAMKDKYGQWDYSPQMYQYYTNEWSSSWVADTLSEAKQTLCAFPIVVSDEDSYPGKSYVDDLQTVKSTYTLFSNEPVSITLVSPDSTNVVSGTAGKAMELPTIVAPEGYQFAGWTTKQLTEETTAAPVIYNGTYFPSQSTTLYALFCRETINTTGTGDYIKVTSEPSDWSGTYVIVYEPDAYIFNSSLETYDQVSNYKAVTITNHTIPAAQGDPYCFEITALEEGYAIKGKSDYYIGRTTNTNGLDSYASPLANSLSMGTEGNVHIISDAGAYLRYNATSGQYRFRYYKNSTYSSQKSICLYEKDGGGTLTYYITNVENTPATPPAPQNYTATFHVPNGADVPENITGSSIVLPAAVAAPDSYNAYNYTFAGWGTTNINGVSEEPTLFAAGESFTLTENTEFFAVYTYSADGQGASVEYMLVENENELRTGKRIIITADNSNGIALSTLQNSNNRGIDEVTISADQKTLSFPANSTVAELILGYGESDNTYSFYDDVNGGFLYAASSSKNYLRTEESLTANSSWTITVENGTATVTATGSNTRNLLQYNSTSNIFSAYSSAQAAIRLYQMTDGAGTAIYYTTVLQSAEVGACTHENTQTQTVPASCTEEGYVSVTCTDCGELVEGTTLTALGHDMQFTRTVAPTATEDGYDLYSCTRCSATEQRNIVPAVGYTASFSVPEGATAPKDLNGTKITLPAAVAAPASFDAHSYTFYGWATDPMDDITTKPTVYKAGASYTLTDNTDFYAVYSYTANGTGGSGEYTLVNDASELSTGSKIVITADNTTGIAMSTTQNNNNRGKTTVTFSDDQSNLTFDASANVAELILGYGVNDGTYSFYDEANSGFLYAASSSSNYLRTESDLTANSSWTISIANGTASVIATGSNSRNNLRYNTGSSIFSCYSSGQMAIRLYQLSASGSVTYYTTILDKATAEECTHQNTMESYTDPSCTEDGSVSVDCVDCGEVLEVTVIPATGHSYDESNRIEATCTEDGSVTYICGYCFDSYSEVLDALGHNYVGGTCTNCGESNIVVPDDYSGRYYIAGIRNNEETYQYLMGVADGSRYDIEDSGLTTLPTYIDNAEANKVFIIEKNADGTYSIYAEGITTTEKYLGWTSGSSGIFVAKTDALKLTIDTNEDGTVNIHFAGDDGERYLALNSNISYTYAAWYKTGIKNLTLIPASEVEGPKYELDSALQCEMSITVGAEMGVAFSVPNALVKNYESFYLVVEKDMFGAETKTLTFGYGDGQTPLNPLPNASNPFLHNASFPGLTAKEMGDEIRVTVYAVDAEGTIHYGPTKTDSIKDYLMRGLDLATSTAEKKTMYVDMLRYGAVAQTYFQYDTENLVDADLTKAQLAFATTEIPEAVDNSKAEGGIGTLNTSVVLKARVTLTLSHLKPGANLANMKFVVKDALDGTVIKELAAYNLNPVMVAADFDDVGAKQMRRLITVTLYDGDTAITDTVTWSVESYVAKIRATSTDAGQIDLVNAMLTYGDAVAAYMATQ